MYNKLLAQSYESWYMKHDYTTSISIVQNEAISEIPKPLTFETYIAELARLPSFFDN